MSSAKYGDNTPAGYCVISSNARPTKVKPNWSVPRVSCSLLPRNCKSSTRCIFLETWLGKTKFKIYIVKDITKLLVETVSLTCIVSACESNIRSVIRQERRFETTLYEDNIVVVLILLVHVSLSQEIGIFTACMTMSARFQNDMVHN